MNKNKNKSENKNKNTREIIAVGYAGAWAGGRVLFRKLRVPCLVLQSSE